MTRPRRCVFLGLAVAALTMSAMAPPVWASPSPIACSTRPRTLTGANGSRTRTFSDLRDLITSAHELGGPRAAVTEYTYDPLEQIIAVMDDQGNPTRVAYDLLGRRTLIDNPDTARIAIVVVNGCAFGAQVRRDFAGQVAGQVVEKFGLAGRGKPDPKVAAAVLVAMGIVVAAGIAAEAWPVLLIWAPRLAAASGAAAGGAAAAAKQLAPRVQLTQRGLEHIVLRHWATSGAQGAGKFAAGTTARSLRAMIRETVWRGTSRANTLGRPGTIFEYNFGRQIGTNIGGNAASNLRVVVSPTGEVTTAFPF